MCAYIYRQWDDLVNICAYQLLHHVRQVIILSFSNDIQ